MPLGSSWLILVTYLAVIIINHLILFMYEKNMYLPIAVDFRKSSYFVNIWYPGEYYATARYLAE